MGATGRSKSGPEQLEATRSRSQDIVGPNTIWPTMQVNIVDGPGAWKLGGPCQHRRGGHGRGTSRARASTDCALVPSSSGISFLPQRRVSRAPDADSVRLRPKEGVAWQASLQQSRTVVTAGGRSYSRSGTRKLKTWWRT